MSDARTELQTSAQMVYADPLKIKSFPAAQAEQVAASIVTRIDISRQFQGVNIYSKQECADCWARFFCSGGCMAHAWFANGDFTKPEEMACALQKKRLECALYAMAATAEA